LTVRGAKLRVALRTPFGSIRFARCDLSFDVHVDSRGDGWVARFAVDGHLPCNDFTGCETAAGAVLPWRARIVRGDGGAQVLRVHDVCFGTCLGQFVGDLRLGLRQGTRGWRLHANHAMVGRTGWELDGGLRTVKGLVTISG